MEQIRLVTLLAEKAKAGSLWVFIVLPVLAVALLTEAVVVLANLLSNNDAPADYLAASLIIAIVVATAIVSFLYYLIGELRKTERELSEKSLRMESILNHHKEAEQNLAQATSYDMLTGLPNRALFLDRLGHAISHAAHSGQMMAVMLIDIDNFKTINDTLGHSLGDILLQEIAERLRHLVPDDDTLARLGGDEFAIILEEMSEIEEAALVSQKVIDIFGRPFMQTSQEIYVTPSMGVTIYPLDGRDSDNLLRNADTAMYRAKEYGRNNFRFYTTDMNALAVERFAMEGALRRAMEREEFLLYYQPQLDIRSGLVVGVEALLRWQHPERGMVPPGDFIPLLEENHLIIPVGEWVLRTACAQSMAWSDEGLPPLRMAVNLSAHQFHQENLAEMIDGILRETGIDPRLLELELTEGLLMENTSETSAVLAQLKMQGLQIAIDDFGTGYSSLSYLKRFPIDRLKIDRSFVRDISTDPNDAAIAVAVINLARSLGLSVIAEGVETREQLAFLDVQKCDEYQGFYFSRPIPAEEIAQLLKSYEPTKSGEV
ncbi:MAG: EAL domain-containing protein [Gammaproteobacteria bacterium]|nr:EAL domain-containing protein [Gammaproteobacteria bacterium]